MKEINNDGLSADHIWPISLGGKHDISNLEPLTLLENINKKNNISIELIKRVKNEPEKYISNRYLEIFNKICQKKEITEETVIELVRELNYSINTWHKYIKELNSENKREYILNYLTEHNISIKKCDEIINDFFEEI